MRAVIWNIAELTLPESGRRAVLQDFEKAKRRTVAYQRACSAPLFL